MFVGLDQRCGECKRRCSCNVAISYSGVDQRRFQVSPRMDETRHKAAEGKAPRKPGVAYGRRHRGEAALHERRRQGTP